MSSPSQYEPLRSQQWFDNPDNPAMTALYLERYLNYGLTREELQGGKPIVGIAQTGSDLAPCNRHHIDLAKRVREGIWAAGGIPFEFPVHPIQETGRRPTAALDRNLAYLGLVELLDGYPLDGVVLLTGCDKTTPACLMAASTVDLPAIVLSGGPMLNGWSGRERVGSGMVIWKGREQLAAGEINYDEFVDIASASAPSVGHCNTMGTALSMNALAETLGMSLPGCAAIPAPHRERGQIAARTGERIVQMVHEQLRPSTILTRSAFENAIRATSALGGSTNAPIHVNAIASHAGVDLTMQDWQDLGYEVPLLVDLQPAGSFLGEDFHRAGGVPAVLKELLKVGLLHSDVITVTGKTLEDNLASQAESNDREIIRAFNAPVKSSAGFLHLRGNLFDSALMKTSVISDEFRQRYLSKPKHPGVFEGKAVVFDGPDDYHARIEDPALDVDEESILIMRGTGVLGFPGAGEVVNMTAPSHLLKRGVTQLPCLGDGRQSGTSDAPSILNASPEAAAGGALALLETGDRVRIDTISCRVDMLVEEEELTRRAEDLQSSGGYPNHPSRTPWQEIQGTLVTQLSDGMVLKPAVKYQRVSQTGLPRDNH